MSGRAGQLLRRLLPHRTDTVAPLLYEGKCSVCIATLFSLQTGMSHSPFMKLSLH